MSQDKRTATQKIEDLEKVVTMLYQSMGQFKNALDSLAGTQQDVTLIKEALKLINKKAEAIVQLATPESGVSSAAVNSLVTKMNAEEMSNQVAEWIKSGSLTPTDTVTDGTYLVVEELYADGTVANPRAQFRLEAQDQVTAEALKGKKSGDVVDFGEGKLSAKILEVYAVVDNSAAQAPAEAPAAEAPAAEAPAAESSASSESVKEADASPAVVLDTLPAESPNTFGLQIHGQADPASASA